MAHTDTFINCADDNMIHEKWSPYFVVGFALNQVLFKSSINPLLRSISGLIEKLSPKIKKQHPKPHLNKRVLGKSIDERPEIIGTRATFGHWKINTVVQNKVKSDAGLLTLAERQTRFEVEWKRYSFS